MAILRLTDGTTFHNSADIDRELASLNIQLQHWPIANGASGAIGNQPQLVSILNQEQLSADDKEIVLTNLDHYFEQLQASGYQSRDLIAINSTTPGLDEMLAKFDRCHTHADDEVRYVVAGEGIFGFVRPDKSQVELTVQAEEYINVPAGTEHWFYLTPLRRVVALRYFIDTSGWTPEYTDTPIAFRTALVGA